MNIAVTGGFLSGKTTLARLLAKKLHCRFFSCDDFVRELYKKKSVRKKVLDTFGEKMYVGGLLQKDQLSRLVFKSEEPLRKLESIIHPLVEAEIVRQAAGRSKSTVFEIPLLYEKGLNRWMDVCVLVWSAKKTCLSRAKLRGFTKKDYEMRTRFQWDTRKKKQWRPWVVKNQGDLKTLDQKSTFLAAALALPVVTS